MVNPSPKVDEWGRQARSGNAAVSDERDKLHDRIRKILALTRSPNEQEAALAAAKLQSLLTEHNLSMADLESRGQASPGVREQSHDLGKAAFKWKLDLAEGIAEFYYCAPIVNRTTKQVAFVGRPDNVEALQMLYAWVIDQIKRIATEERRKHIDSTGEHIDPLRWQVSFGVGAVERLVERMVEMKDRQAAEMSRDEYGGITALALSHNKEVSDYLEERFGYRRDGRKTKRQTEYEAELVKRKERQDKLKAECEAAGNMEPYYLEYPWERPDTPAEAAAREKDRKRRDRNWRRRMSRESRGITRSRGVDRVKEEQSGAAKQAGYRAGDRVNLQPFIGSGSGGGVKGNLK